MKQSLAVFEMRSLKSPHIALYSFRESCICVYAEVRIGVKFNAHSMAHPTQSRSFRRQSWLIGYWQENTQTKYNSKNTQCKIQKNKAALVQSLLMPLGQQKRDGHISESTRGQASSQRLTKPQTNWLIKQIKKSSVKSLTKYSEIKQRNQYYFMTQQFEAT